MKKRWFAVLFAAVVLALTACGPTQPPTTPGTWDASNWDSTANWQ
jgi:hypothetical protein